MRAYIMSMAMTVRRPEGSGYKVSTIERHLTSIGHAHSEAGDPAPGRHPRVESVMQGLRRQLGSRPRRMRPLMLDDIRSIVSRIDCSTWPAGVGGIRDSFVILAGFASAMRRSELAAVRRRDVRFNPSLGLVFHIPVSKGDQEGHGAYVALPRGAQAQTCPVCAYVRWVELVAAAEHGRAEMMRLVLDTPQWADRGHVCGAGAPESGGLDEPILRAVLRGGHIGGSLSGDALHRIIQRRAAHVGITGDIGFHSLRAGFVTQARRNGADTRSVRRQTRHSSDALVDVYDREHSPLIDNAVLDLGL